MYSMVRWMFAVAALSFSVQLSASTGLTLIRDGVGVVGRPVQLSAKLDSNHNGRGELLITNTESLAIIEEDDSGRGYRELARSRVSNFFGFERAILIDLPGAPPMLLIAWLNGIELRDATTLQPKASMGSSPSALAFGDFDGDGAPEILFRSWGPLLVLDPLTLEERASLPLFIGGEMVAADILGDARAEVVMGNGIAYSISRSGDQWSATQVWDAKLPEFWRLHVVEYEGRSAIVLHDRFGYSAQLATFWPSPSMRPIVSADESSFSLAFADVNGDSRTDLITATSHQLRALDIATGAILWTRDTIYQEPRIGSISWPVTVDLDGDDKEELVWSGEVPNSSGIVALTVPPVGAPRWRTDDSHSTLIDWTFFKRGNDSSSIAYLTQATEWVPGLSSIGFIDGMTFSDQGGSAFAWLPGYEGITGPYVRQTAIAQSPLAGPIDSVIVVGAESHAPGGEPLASLLWTFDSSGSMSSARVLESSIDPKRVDSAQVLDRSERQVVVAGLLPESKSEPAQQSARVEIVDYDTGNLLWQSAPIPGGLGASMSRLEIADLDADGDPEIVIGYGQVISVFKPRAGAAVQATHVGQHFALLNRGIGVPAVLATLDGLNVHFYEGMSTVPTKSFVLPEPASRIAIFMQPPEDAVMFATASSWQIEVRRYSDGEIEASAISQNSARDLIAMDTDGDNRIEFFDVVPGFRVWRLESDSIFRNGFDGAPAVLPAQ
jgi:hypothetical protein